MLIVSSQTGRRHVVRMRDQFRRAVQVASRRAHGRRRHSAVAGAQRSYAEASTQANSWQCWTNLAALALGLEDFEAALANARKAIVIDPGHADAWVNAGVASWRKGARKDGARLMAHALQLAPAHATAAINYSYMLRTVERLREAHEVLAGARSRGARTPGVLRAMAELERILERSGECRANALEALRILAGNPWPPPITAKPPTARRRSSWPSSAGASSTPPSSGARTV